MKKTVPPFVITDMMGLESRISQEGPALTKQLLKYDA